MEFKEKNVFIDELQSLFKDKLPKNKELRSIAIYPTELVYLFRSKFNADAHIKKYNHPELELLDCEGVTINVNNMGKSLIFKISSTNREDIQILNDFILSKI